MVRSDQCTGCGACEAVCHENAIKMIPDEHGFLHPKIDYDLCINCNMCEKVCPVTLPRQRSTELSCFAAYSRDEEIRSHSSSGGMFSVLAKSILSQGGIVVGCAMSDDSSCAKHILIESEDELWKLQGSKYVQSAINGVFRKVKNYLSDGMKVLFSGTPCQVAGLKSYLGNRSQDHLFCVDIICHGVPSPAVWKKYLSFREEKAASKTQRTFFRHKYYGWKKYSLLLKFFNNKEYRETVCDDLYLRGFISNLYLRSSCYECNFKQDNYYSDLTLADFWGVQEIFPKMNDDKGVSLVIAHTEKGEYFFNAIKSGVEYREVLADKALRSNPSYWHSVASNNCSKYFWKDFEKLPIGKAIDKYIGTSFASKLRRRLLK